MKTTSYKIITTRVSLNIVSSNFLNGWRWVTLDISFYLYKHIERYIVRCKTCINIHVHTMTQPATVYLLIVGWIIRRADATLGENRSMELLLTYSMHPHCHDRMTYQRCSSSPTVSPEVSRSIFSYYDCSVENNHGVDLSLNWKEHDLQFRWLNNMIFESLD